MSRFHAFWVIPKVFYLVNFYILLSKEDFLNYYYIIVSSIDVWHSYFAHTCCQTHFMLFCHEFTFVTSYALSQIKEFLLKPWWGKKKILFPCLIYGRLSFTVFFCFVTLPDFLFNNPKDTKTKNT